MSESSTAWERARELYDQAAALPDDKRVRFLRIAAERDPKLQAILETLLATDEPPHTFLEPPGFSMHEALEAVEPQGHPIDGVFAGYRIQDVAGQGGSSVVYQALQEHPQRIVALKVLRGTALNQRVLRRFEHESDLLARLKHPNIAQIFAAGTENTPLGPQPYIAMEFVTGQPITLYVREARLDRVAILQLFLKVCRAVHHAHQRGVIHRDIKPANLLIEQDGTPKVLDFGVARLTDEEDAMTKMTHTGDLIGTMPYMSPEQISGHSDAIDTRSDIYSLGLVLYELMTGELPYSVADMNLSEATHVICEQEPPTGGSWQRALRGDLETIVRKALRKEPEQRYASVAALSEDIERFLRNEPILARRPSTAYHLRKLLARHTLLVSLSAVLLLSLIGFSIGMSLLYTLSEHLRRIAEDDRTAALEARDAESAAREQAERSRDTATAVQQFVAGIFNTPNSRRDSDITVSEALDRAVKRLGTDTSINPGIASEIRISIGKGYYALRDFAKAEREFRRAYEICAEHLGANHPTTARCAFHWGRTLRLVDRRDEGAALLEQAIEVWRMRPDDDDGLLPAALDWLAMTRMEQDRLNEAERLLEEAVRLIEPISGRHPGIYGLILRHMGHLYRRRGRLLLAEEIYHKAAQFRADGGARFDAGNNLLQLVLIRLKLGNREGARHAIELWLETAPKPSEVINPSVVKQACMMSKAMRQAGLTEQADMLLKEVVEAANDSDVPKVSRHARNALLTLGAEHLASGELSDAEQAYRTANELGCDLTPLEQARIQYRLGTVLWQRGQWSEAETRLRESLKLQREHSEAAIELNAFTQQSMGQLLLAQQRPESALPFLNAALDGMIDNYGDAHPDVAVAMSFVARAQAKLGAVEEATILSTKALSAFHAAKQKQEWMLALLLDNSAHVQLANRNYVAAETAARVALETLELHFGPGSHHAPAVMSTLGNVLRAQGRHDEARDVFQQSLEHQLETYDGCHWSFEEIRAALADLES